MPVFPLGDIVVTAGALVAFKEAGVSQDTYLERHARGDWGDIPQSDAFDNVEALGKGHCLISVYALHKGQEVWIVTDEERAATRILTLDEYEHSAETHWHRKGVKACEIITAD